VPKASSPRPCAFVPAAGRKCPHAALPRRPYCHLHSAIHQAAGTVAGGFVSEMLSWFVPRPGSFGEGSFGGEPPYQRPRAGADGDPIGGPEFERLIDEVLRGFRETANRAGNPVMPPGQAPRRQLNYYHVLGVSPTATTDEIKKAFRKLAFENHPDRQKDKPPAEQQAATDRFKKAAEAWSHLGDPNKRAAFDQMLRYARPVPAAGG